MSWYNASWDYRVKVTVLATQVDANLTDFPVYVDLSALPAGFHTNVNQTDARDIRVTTSDGVTEVPREVVFYDAGNDEGELHFKAPTLSSTANTDFYIYYGNVAATEPAAGDTYGRNAVWSDYGAVYHMGADPSSTAPQEKDSTANANHLTSSGSMTSGDVVSGKIGKSIDFDGTDDRYTAPSSASLNFGTGDYSIQAWFKTSSTASSNRGFIAKGNPRNIGGYGYQIMFLPSLDRIYYYNSDGDPGNSQIIGTEANFDGLWHQVTATIDRGTVAKIYTDGTQLVSDTTQLAPQTDSIDNTGNLEINTATNPYVGEIDEIRLRPSYLSAEWVATEYNNQSSPSTFFTIGAEESQPSGTTEGSLAFLQTAVDASDLTTYTFSSQNLGVADADRYIIVSAVARKAGAGLTLSSVSVGGVSATITQQITNTGTNSNTAGIAIAKVPTGTTGDIIVTWSTGVLRCQIGVWRATGITGLTAYDADGSTASAPSVSLDVPIGFAIGVALSGVSTTATWTGLTEDYDATVETWVTGTGASQEFESAEVGRTITSTFGKNAESAGVFASWEYAEVSGGTADNSERSATLKGSLSDNSARSATLTGAYVTPQYLYWSKINSNTKQILKAVIYEKEVSKTSDSSIDWHVSADGGSNWESVTPGSVHDIVNAGADLRLRATLNASTDGQSSPSLDRVSIVWTEQQSVDTSDERAIKLTGKETSASERSATLYGQDATSSERRAKLHGQDTDSDDRSAKTTGQESTSSEQEAKITGQDSSSSERPANLWGEQSVQEDRSAKVSGSDTDSDDRSAKVTGQDSDSEERAAKLHGELTDTDERSAKTTGQASDDSERSAHLIGEDTDSDERPAKLHGQETDSDDRSAKVTGVNTSEDDRSARLWGEDTDSEDRSAKLTGELSDTDERSALLLGQDSASVSRSVRLRGEITYSDERPAKVFGQDSSFDERSAKTTGQDSDSSERGASTWGEVDTAEDRSAKVSGENEQSEDRSAKIHGQDSQSDERPASLWGKQTDESQRPAKTSGVDTTNDERGAKALGELTDQSERTSRLHGSEDVLSDRDATLSGVDRTNSRREASVWGQKHDESERPGRMHGVDTIQVDRLAKTTGKLTANSQRSAKLRGTGKWYVLNPITWFTLVANNWYLPSLIDWFTKVVTDWYQKVTKEWYKRF